MIFRLRLFFTMSLLVVLDDDPLLKNGCHIILNSWKDITVQEKYSYVWRIIFASECPNEMKESYVITSNGLSAEPLD